MRFSFKMFIPPRPQTEKHMGATPSAGPWLLLLLELQIHLNMPRHSVSRKQKTEECLNKLVQNPVICTVSEDYVYGVTKKKEKAITALLSEKQNVL